MGVDLTFNEDCGRTGAMARDHVVYRVAYHDKVLRWDIPGSSDFEDSCWMWLWWSKFSGDNRREFMVGEKLREEMIHWNRKVSSTDCLGQAV